MITTEQTNKAFKRNEDALTSILWLDGYSSELRDIGEWAEEEIILPMDGGPFEGQPFELARQPYVRLLYDEIMFGNWSEYIITGPSQSGKTLSAFVIPLLWILLELRKNTICGVPDGNMIADKWAVDVEPVFRANPTLDRYLPTTGPGSKGGTIKEFVKLNNGVRLRFMTAGGSDQSKAGFTATHMCVTEAAGFSNSKKQSTSKEASALRQLRARQRSASRFDDSGRLTKDRQMFVEGTVTDEDDLPWSALEGSSRSQIVQQCPSCSKWVSPERTDLSGWVDAKSELEAARIGSFFCPNCGEEISEATRRKMVESCKLLHDGQSIDKRGRVKGKPPETGVLWFRWSAFQNLFLKTADLCAEEWKADQLDTGSLEWEEAEKELSQQVWCQPFRPAIDDAGPIEANSVRKRTHKLTSGIVPADCDKLVFGCDVGRYRCWYFAISFNKDGTLHCPVYGSVDTSMVKGGKVQREHEKSAIKNAIREMFDLIDNPWPMVASATMKTADLVHIDGGYFPDAVIEVCNEYGRGLNSRFRMIDGVGKSEMASRVYSNPKRTNKTIRKISKPAGKWHVEFRNGGWVTILNADQSKIGVQNCLRVEPGEPGSLTLPAAPQREHRLVARHLSSEVFRRWVEPGKGVREEWVKSGQNHLLDCAGYAWIGGDCLGWKMPTPKKEKPVGGNWLSEQLRKRRAGAN